jgi:hypothetical protein
MGAGASTIAPDVKEFNKEAAKKAVGDKFDDTIFDNLANAKGVVSRADFDKACKSAEGNDGAITEAKFHEIIALLDTDGDGNVTAVRARPFQIAVPSAASPPVPTARRPSSRLAGRRR